jgi:transcriptional regulator MraZ
MWVEVVRNGDSDRGTPSMFRGSSYNTLDSKHRVKIPSRYVDILRGNQETHLVLTIFEGYLLAYPQSTWAKEEQKLLGLDQFTKENRDHIRKLSAKAEDCFLDKQGRVVIPQALRELAKIRNNVVVVGMINHFEIWDRERYESYQNKQEGPGN